MVLIILGDGFEEAEAVVTFDVLRRGGIPVRLVYTEKGKRTVIGAHGLPVNAEYFAGDVTPDRDDMVVIPGGMKGVEAIKASRAAMYLIDRVNSWSRHLAAICAGPSVLAELGHLEGVNITCHPGCEDMMGGAICNSDTAVVQDGTIITGRSAGVTFEFALAIVKLLKGEKIAQKVREELLL